MVLQYLASMKKIIVVFAFAGSLLHVGNCMAWGRKGHTIVTDIAYTRLDSLAQKALAKYLDGMTHEEAGNWMDDMRSNHKYDHMKPWHYVNIEKGTTYSPNTDANIVNTIDKAITALEHSDKMKDDDIKFNILLLCHLVGDFYMPLHVGYANDKGGNEVQVKYLNNPSNLHKVWDTDIIESERITLNDCLLRLNTFTKRDIDQFSTLNAATWITEPRALLDRVYDFQDNTIDQAYIDRNKKTVEDQLLIAGIRLGAVLQHLFGAKG